MRRNLKAVVAMLLCLSVTKVDAQKKQEKYILVIHGGAGTITKANMTAEKEVVYRAALTLALQTGYNTLKSGKTSLDAVEATVQINTVRLPCLSIQKVCIGARLLQMVKSRC